MDNTGDFTNAGIFGDVTYRLTDTVRVSAGLRYSFDDKTYSWQTFPEQTRRLALSARARRLLSGANRR